MMIKRGRRGGSLLSAITQSNAMEHRGAMLPALRKWLVRDDQEVEAQRGGRRRLVDSSVLSSSLAEVDKGQPPRRQQ